MSLFQRVDICTKGAKARVGNNAGVLTCIKAMALKCADSHTFHHQVPAVKGRKKMIIKTVLNVLKIINFIEFQSLSRHLFNILCNEIVSMHEALLLYSKMQWLFLRMHLYGCLN